jgi:hypothetical protein
MLALLNWLLGCVESLFPLVPLRLVDEDWVPAWKYYFLDDHSYRFGQRLLAVLTLEWDGVSFWRRREERLRNRRGAGPQWFRVEVNEQVLVYPDTGRPADGNNAIWWHADGFWLALILAPSEEDALVTAEGLLLRKEWQLSEDAQEERARLAKQGADACAAALLS